MKPAKPAVRAATALLTFIFLAAACGSSSETVSEVVSEAGSETGSEAISDAESSTDSDSGEDATVDAHAASDADDSMVADAAQGTPVDAGLFFDGALAEEISTQDCTLSDGSASTCYLVTVVGYPVDNEIGPFCPSTTDTSAEEAGIWFDGDGLYDLDGEFILGLAELYNDSNWMLYDEDGNVNVTETAEAFDAAARPNVDPEYQNHCVEGRIEWLDGGEPVQSTVLLPASPTLATSPSQTRGSLGVTLNGVAIDAAAPVDAILGAYTIAAFDDCGGHINPVAGYHLHGATGCGEVEMADHAAMFGYALDGFAIHSPYGLDGDRYADLDGCGGHTTDDLGYHYHASPAAENAVIGCISGLTAQ
ncbi:MAG: YHYH protein [Acidimicrobiales bacterium]